MDGDVNPDVDITHSAVEISETLAFTDQDG